MDFKVHETDDEDKDRKLQEQHVFDNRAIENMERQQAHDYDHLKVGRRNSDQESLKGGMSHLDGKRLQDVTFGKGKSGAPPRASDNAMIDVWAPTRQERAAMEAREQAKIDAEAEIKQRKEDAIEQMLHGSGTPDLSVFEPPPLVLTTSTHDAHAEEPSEQRDGDGGVDPANKVPGDEMASEPTRPSLGEKRKDVPSDADNAQQGKDPTRHVDKDLRRFKVNDDYFKKIDTPEKAYILGLLASDGNLRNDMPSVRLRMLKDDELFGKIKKELDSNRPIKDYMNEMGNMMSTLEIYSKKMHEDLQNLGLKPGAKSSDLRFPNTSKLPENVQRDFIRGVFDGDGSISIFSRNRGDKGYDFAVVGNKQFLASVKEIMERDCKVNKVKLAYDQRTVGTYTLKYGGPKNMGKIFEYLYGKNGNTENQICMRRKYEKMKEAYDYYKDRLNERRIIDVEKLSQDMTKAVKDKPLTISECAARLNHKRSTIKKYGLMNPDLELVFPDGRNSVFRLKGQELKDHIYPEKYSDKVLEKYLMKSQINAFKQFASAGLYDCKVKRSFADIGKKIGLSADNVKQQATRIKERLLAIPNDELQ